MFLRPVSCRRFAASTPTQLEDVLLAARGPGLGEEAQGVQSSTERATAAPISWWQQCNLTPRLERFGENSYPDITPSRGHFKGPSLFPLGFPSEGENSHVRPLFPAAALHLPTGHISTSQPPGRMWCLDPQGSTTPASCRAQTWLSDVAPVHLFVANAKLCLFFSSGRKR